MNVSQDLVGPVSARIFVRTGRRHADLFVRVCDVDEKGVSRNIVDGIRRLSPQTVPDETDPVGETLAWALGRLDQPLPVGHLARRARMSRRHFDRRFREVTGTTPTTWLTHQRVLRARQLLEETRLPVEEVARRCGFSGAAALRPHFRRIVGTVPVAYRAAFAVDDPVVR